ncbi:hypothetical protein BDV33DRAFT_188289 [Aspergillus novoparasiticus]|uniref:FAD-binding FR-type domain-containing protein n=1 Tax=Aspergillus novoparasiticus TaxID=986946 RepID=A0A5N6F6E5_9EURO|nr:hypothetical protein BDV33DRAFT_188289 [Aspergillus novoparasiticus]
MATTALHGWHPGEISIQRKLGYTDAVKDAWPTIRNIMPEQHRVFHTSKLPFIPITTVDEDGRPWAAIVTGSTGEPGFVHSPDSQNLSIHAHLWDGDPLLDTVKAWVDPSSALSTISQRSLAAGLGIEFSTRRRNKFAGTIQSVECQSNLDYKLHLRVTQTTGYGRLPEEVVAFILQADTAFVASIYESSSSDLHMFPPHAGMNARSGLPGFIRVSPSDGRTVVVPDYSGNRFMSTLGNIETSGMVGLTIVSFTTGDILYLTGTAKTLIGPLALEVMTRHTALTSVNVTGFVFVRDALPVRQQDGTPVERSPYSPKIKYLVEETGAQSRDNKEHKAKLQEAVQVSPDLAVFKFQVISKPGAGDLRIRPGQAIVLDFMDWIGPPQYQHMQDTAPNSINDDRVRTWTVSSAHEERNATCFELTMREMKGGAVTGALFDCLRKYRSTQLGQRIVFDTPVVADIVGVTGDFFMDRDRLDALWVAGGIGITPFLAMLRALAERGSAAEGDIMLVLATREPNTMLHMMRSSLERIESTVRINIAIFTHDSKFDSGNLKPNQNICVHRGRVVPDFWKDIPRGKDVFICGPSAFGDSVADALRAVGVSPSQIRREGFY